MKIKPLYLLNAILIIALLTSILAYAPTNRNYTAGLGEYDPWKDLNDDGIVDIFDIVKLATAFGASGIPMNKTALLNEVQTARTHNETYSNTYAETMMGSGALFFHDMPNMSVDITLASKATLLIMFSTQAKITGTTIYYTYIRAVVDSDSAYPDSEYIVLTNSPEWGMYSFTFYMPNINAGTHTIKIQWKLYDENNTGQAYERTLVVMALP